MNKWRMEMITDETEARLSQSRYHKLGGWLLVFLICLAWVSLKYLSSMVVLAVRIVKMGASIIQEGRDTSLLSLWIDVLLVLFVTPTAAGCVCVEMLRKRNIWFRIPFVIFAVILIYMAIITKRMVFAALLTALATVYIFTSDRVRVYCNQRPRRKIPMPVEEAATEPPEEKEPELV